MIDLGFLFPLLGAIGILLWFWGGRIYRARWFLWILVLSIVMTEVATIAGWWTAEVGRQPWIVWNLMKTADAVSPNLRTEQVFLSLGMFVLLYGLLFSLFIFLLNQKIQEGPAPLEFEKIPASLPDTLREVFRHARASGGPEDAA
jgi:cytochrome d ubiquinol oxidase subunit I